MIKFSLSFKVSVDILFSRELLPIPTFSRFPFKFCQQTGEGWTGDSNPPSLHQWLQGRRKKYVKSGQADQRGGGSPPSSLTETICENFDPFLSFIKWKNNPKYGNLSRKFHIYPGLKKTVIYLGFVTASLTWLLFHRFFFEPFPFKYCLDHWSTVEESQIFRFRWRWWRWCKLYCDKKLYCDES